MALYFRLKSIPELRDLPPEARRRLWERACREATPSDRGRRAKRFILHTVAFLLLWGVAVSMRTWGMVLLPFTLQLVIFLISEVEYLNARVPHLRPQLRRLVEEEFGPRCHVCGYDLRATPRRCPECGTVRGVL